MGAASPVADDRERAINRPDRDELLIREAGIRLDRALFPLLVLTERFGPIGVVNLAGRVDSDHSTVSRQAAKFVTLGLVERCQSAADRRVFDLHGTPAGREIARRIDAARERLARCALLSWSERQVTGFVDSLRRYTDALSSP